MGCKCGNFFWHMIVLLCSDLMHYMGKWIQGYTPKAGTFIPFGAGNRLCPGNDLAKMEISIFLHYFLLGYQWVLLSPFFFEVRDNIHISYNFYWFITKNWKTFLKLSQMHNEFSKCTYSLYMPCHGLMTATYNTTSLILARFSNMQQSSIACAF